MEASKERREEYLKIIKDIPAKSVVYIDESGIDLNICKDRGWGRKSEKLIGKKSGKYYERTNIIAGYVILILIIKYTNNHNYRSV